MNILFVGDIVGRPGRNALRKCLPQIVSERNIDATVVNAENAAGGLGATPEILDDLLDFGVDAITMGNHTWRKRVLISEIDNYPKLARPANYPDGVPGSGHVVTAMKDGRNLGVINLIGRVFMEAFDCPFRTAKREIDAVAAQADTILVDFHAEATSEKMAMGWFLDGSCAAVVGTHTHVQTADERILPQGTAYITDVGMTGPRDGVIGVITERVVDRFLTGLPHAFDVASGPTVFSAVIIETDDATGRARSIERIMQYSNEESE